MKILYTANATTTGGGRAHGHGRTDDGQIDVTLTTPKAMGGDGAPGTNPEQLFAVAYSACYLGALKGAARRETVKLPAEASVTAHVSFADREDGIGFAIVVALDINLPGIARADAERVVATAHTICPWSWALGNKVEVTSTIV
jgi:osmotically inducible protein OsmC